MSLRFDLAPNRRAAARFIGATHRDLAREIWRAAKEKGVSQKQIADKLGVHKSTISRILSGKQNLTLRTISDVCWAIGVEPKLVFSEALRTSNETNMVSRGSSRQRPVPTTVKSTTSFSGLHTHPVEAAAR